jgi:hypothetical protein
MDLLEIITHATILVLAVIGMLTSIGWMTFWLVTRKMNRLT